MQLFELSHIVQLSKISSYFLKDGNDQPHLSFYGRLYGPIRVPKCKAYK